MYALAGRATGERACSCGSAGEGAVPGRGPGRRARLQDLSETLWKGLRYDYPHLSVPSPHAARGFGQASLARSGSAARRAARR